jgi:hypothetical protein
MHKTVLVRRGYLLETRSPAVKQDIHLTEQTKYCGEEVNRYGDPQYEVFPYAYRDQMQDFISKFTPQFYRNSNPTNS